MPFYDIAIYDGGVAGLDLEGDIILLPERGPVLSIFNLYGVVILAHARVRGAWRTVVLYPLEIGFAFFNKGSHTFFCILALAQWFGLELFQPEGLVQG